MLKHKLKHLLNVDYYKDKTINKIRYLSEFKDLKVKENY
jgi:hypothetical protein